MTRPDILTGAWQFEVFYDGDCPLCTREIDLLARLDSAGSLRFTDISVASFDPVSHGLALSTDDLMASIHGRASDGTVYTGVEVFRRLYSAVGFGALVSLTRLPGVRQTLDAAYRSFARNRLLLTGRCPESACGLPDLTHHGSPQAA